MKQSSFRTCMLISALALLGIASYYFASYFKLKVALDNNHLEPFLNQSIRALWLSFSCQGLLIGLLYLLVTFKPHAVSREVIVLLGLGQLVEAFLLFALAGSKVVISLLAIASLFVLVGALLWPKKLPKVDAMAAAGVNTATP